MDGPAHDAWSDMTPGEITDLLDGFGQAWWICGGWALDPWLGRQTRPYADLDVGVYRNGPFTLDTCGSAASARRGRGSRGRRQAPPLKRR